MPETKATNDDPSLQNSTLPVPQPDNPTASAEEQKKVQEELLKKAEEWSKKFDEDLHALFQKHSVEEYVLCFMHPITKRPALMGASISGETYRIARLATAAARRLKAQIDKELEC